MAGSLPPRHDQRSQHNRWINKLGRRRGRRRSCAVASVWKRKDGHGVAYRNNAPLSDGGTRGMTGSSLPFSLAIRTAASKSGENARTRSSALESITQGPLGIPSKIFDMSLTFSPWTRTRASNPNPLRPTTHNITCTIGRKRSPRRRSNFRAAASLALAYAPTARPRPAPTSRIRPPQKQVGPSIFVEPDVAWDAAFGSFES